MFEGEAMNNSRKHIVISTLICLGTMLVFLAFYRQLPDNVPVQIQFGGTAQTPPTAPSAPTGQVCFTSADVVHAKEDGIKTVLGICTDLLRVSGLVIS